MITPELVVQVAQATRDYRITAAEFQGIMNTLTNIAGGVLAAGAVGMLVGAVGEKFARETAFEVREVAGIPLPVLEHHSPPERYTLAELRRMLEEKYQRPFAIKTEPLPFISEYDARYDPASDTIFIGRELRGKARLVALSHEVGHKLHIDELKAQGKPVLRTRETAREQECEAYKRGLEVADMLGVKQEFIRKWRGDIFPLAIPAFCPPPGDDKIGCGQPFTVKAEGGTYTGPEFARLLRRYVETGRWHD
jgi:hypothetical protein